jgi:hypothetical protein
MRSLLQTALVVHSARSRKVDLVDTNGTYRVVEPNSLILPKFGDLHRTPPRPIHLRQANYDDRFDFDTVFCDAFRDVDEKGADVVVLTGPPLLNLNEPFGHAEYMNVDSGIAGHAELHDVRGTQQSRVAGLGNCSTLHITLPSGFSRELPVAANERNLFRGRKCLVTVSKDNELVWIRDWARFYAKLHGVDAVLLYDNGSTKYNTSDVLEALGSVEGIEVAVVVDWPFPFGPQAGNWDGLRGVKWDSSYCQSTLLEHARWRYLNEAAGVLHCDIDELMVSETGTFFDDLDASDGLIFSEGRWIEAIRKDGSAGVPRFIDYQWWDDRRQPTTRKWLVDPRRCSHAKGWRTHGVLGVEGQLSTNTSHRHFRGISTSWKFDRSDTTEVDTDHHHRDDVLLAALEQAFEGEDVFSFADRRPLTSSTIRGRIRDAASSLSPTPVSVKFADPDTLILEFSENNAAFAAHIRFRGADIASSIQAHDESTAESLARLYGGSGPWRLDKDAMRRRTKATVVGNVIRHLQGRLDAVCAALPKSTEIPKSAEAGPEENVQAPGAPLSRRLARKAKAAWARLR